MSRCVSLYITPRVHNNLPTLLTLVYIYAIKLLTIIHFVNIMTHVSVYVLQEYFGCLDYTGV